MAMAIQGSRYNARIRGSWIVSAFGLAMTRNGQSLWRLVLVELKNFAKCCVYNGSRYGKRIGSAAGSENATERG